jgi:DnaJ-class molecular chaperone
VIADEGMPSSKNPGTKGSLHIRFTIKFPRELQPEQKKELAKTLAGSC